MAGVSLEEFLGGNTEPVTVLIEADITDDRTLRNMLDFSEAIEDPEEFLLLVTDADICCKVLGGIVARNLYFSHMANVEDSHLGADCLMLFHGTAIANWHIPAAKVDNLCFKRSVLIIKRSLIRHFESP